jgi:hypothetical protein
MPFTFTLQHEDGSPAEPPTLPSAVPNWSPGDAIPPGGSRMLRVIEIRPTPEPDGDPVLVMEAA